MKEGVVAVAVPGNYDDSSIMIRVDPDTLWPLASSDIANHIKNLADSVSDIAHIWNNLKVGWVGTSASDAHEFNAKWSQAVGRLFGSKSDSKSGVLPKIAVAVAQAAMNYGVAEDTNVTNLKNYVAGITMPAGGNTVNSPPTRGGSQGPVTENGGPPPNGNPPDPAVNTSPSASEDTPS